MDANLEIIKNRPIRVDATDIVYKGVTVADADADEEDVLYGKYFYSKTDQKKCGKILTVQKEITPTTEETTYTPEENRLYSSVKVAAVTLQEKTVTPAQSVLTVTPDQGNMGLSKVTVNAMPDTLWNTADADMTAADLALGKTGYGAEGKVTGTAFNLTSDYYSYLNGTMTEFTPPAAVTDLAPYLCYYYQHLQKVHIPPTIKGLGRNTFSYCEYCTELYFDADVERLPSGTAGIFTHFGHKSVLSGAILKIGPNVHTLPGYLFYSTNANGENAKFKKILFENSNVHTIGDRVFCNQYAITSFWFPPSIQTIGKWVLDNCINLMAVVIPTTTVPTITNYTFGSGDIVSKTGRYFYVRDDMVDAFKSANVWSNYSSKILPLSSLPSEYDIYA